ncbi:claudin-4-like [Neosynchiropus ocellatus]
MSSLGMQMAGCALALLGWIGVLITCGTPMWRGIMALQELGFGLSMAGVAATVLICALPMWKVTAFIGTHLVVMQVFWEGLWMTCVSEYTGQMQCKLYDALLDLSPDLQAARGLVCISLVLGCLGFLVFLLGARCTNCLGHPQVKARVVLASGVIFCLSALTTIVPVAWTAHTIIMDFYNPRVPAVLKRELGAAIYIGFITSGLLFCGGGILCLSCPPQKSGSPSGGYRRARTPVSSGYAFKNYV